MTVSYGFVIRSGQKIAAQFFVFPNTRLLPFFGEAGFFVVCAAQVYMGLFSEKFIVADLLCRTMYGATGITLKMFF